MVPITFESYVSISYAFVSVFREPLLEEVPENAKIILSGLRVNNQYLFSLIFKLLTKTRVRHGFQIATVLQEVHQASWI